MPAAVPVAPIHRPCSTNVFKVSRRVRPIALRMPISRVRLTTTMTNVLTMLNAATKTMRDRITPIASFSSLSAEKSSRLVRVHGSTA